MTSPFLPRAALGALLLLLCACGGGSRTTAAEDVNRFLTAVAQDDRTAFETLVDRPAVRDDLRGQIVSVARAEGVEVEGGPSDFALDRMIAPATLRLVEAAEGRVEPPTAEALAGQLKTLDAHSVCLTAKSQADRCLLTFRRTKKNPFRLVAMQMAPPTPIAAQP